MIISASRRTDIPAFYSDWLLNRLRDGSVLVPHPRIIGRYSHVHLNPEVVDCIVFWTKNPGPMLNKLDIIGRMGYPFYFQYTLTPYDGQIERNLPPKPELVDVFKRLSQKLGPNRVVWRYDPVITSNSLDIQYHLDSFEKMASMLEGCTNHCIFSFVDLYQRVRPRLMPITDQEVSEADMHLIAEGFSKIARDHQMRLSTCSESIDLSLYGITHASCIDKKLIEEIIGSPIKVKKDAGQRPGCGCVESIDIGTYGSCSNECVYCYGFSGSKTAQKNIACHDPASPLLIGQPDKAAIISEREVKSLKDMQTTLFD